MQSPWRQGGIDEDPNVREGGGAYDRIYDDRCLARPAGSLVPRCTS